MSKSENVMEKFIDKNIAELCMQYDKIRGANVNIARITPELIDGLKPVQRRALYIMFLKDHGKSFRKLATISGDTFGRIHPHCLHGDTEFILTNGTKMTIRDMYESGQAEFEVLSYVDKVSGVTRATMKSIRITKHVDSLYNIRFTNGYSVKCTNDHSILVMREIDNDFIPCWIKAEDIHPGDLLYSGEISNLSFEGVDVGIDIDRLLNDLKYSFIQVESVSIEKFNNPLPVYDFTVDGYENAVAYAGGRSEIDHSFIVLHNSPTSVTDAIIGIEQPWHNTIPLVEGKGNWGGVDGSPAGADRYISARLSEYSQACFFDDWNNAVVDMTMGYDDETKEPLYLPAKYPNVLINGCLGIGYGMASNIPSFNFKECIDACIMLIADPNANIVLIPDSPTGASIIEGDFYKLTNSCNSRYSQRCTYEIDAENNVIRITSLPYLITVNDIRQKIADIKDKGGLSELIDMNDMTGVNVDLQLVIRDDVNPYKFMKKLIKSVSGLEKDYPVNIVVTNDYETFDYSIKDLLLRWIGWRREQKRVAINHRRTTLLAEQRTNDVKIFMLDKKNMNDVKEIYRTGRNRAEIEKRLVEKYHDSEIRMDSLQARTLSNLRMVDLSIEAYESYLKRRDEIAKELNEVEDTLKDDNGIDKIIIGELRDGAKRFGAPRKSNVIPYKISLGTEVAGVCILQLSSDGMITRRTATNVDEEPVPQDSNGFAVRVDNDSSFILIDNTGHHSFIKVKDLPIDVEVPVNRYSKQNLNGNIIAMLPVDIENDDMCCTLISKKGQLKKIRISEIGPSKKACIALSDGDTLVRGIITKSKSSKDILIYTKNGMGQRFDPNSVRITSINAKGGNGFKLKDDDEILGCYAISPEENRYILYMTTKGKARLNLIEYLPMRDSKHDAMVKLISLNDRDKLISVTGCNKFDKLQIFFDDGTDEVIEINTLPESTMSSDPKKVTSKNAVTTNIVKTKLI